MSYTQLRAFHAVVEQNGFTTAAKWLNVSQSTITMQVRDLETAHNIDLFHRKGRGISLTEAGKDLYILTGHLVRNYQNVMDYLAATKILETGHLNFAVVGPFHAAEMAKKFKHKYPNIDLKLIFGNSQQTLDAIVNSQADIAILADANAPKNVEMEFYSEQKIVVFVSNQHRFYGRKSIKLDELEGEGFILREKGSTTLKMFEAALKEHKINIKCILEIGSREGVWKAVSLGLGIGVVADFEFVASPEIQALQISDVDVISKYYIAYLKNRKKSPLIDAFRRVILDV